MKSIIVLSVLFSAVTAAAHDRSKLRVGTYAYDPNNTGAVMASWKPFSGPGDSDPALLFGKLVPTAVEAAGVAEVEGVKNLRLNELGFDVFRGGHCGAGAPRFNVITKEGYLYFFGCIYGDQTPAPGKPGLFTRVRFSDADAHPQLVTNPPWPGFGNARIARIQIVFDEGTDVGSGFIALDNIDVNGTLIGKGSREDDCDD